MPVIVVAHVAQSAEHFLGKEEVTGSIPVMGSINSGAGWFRYPEKMQQSVRQEPAQASRRRHGEGKI
jgi:hypothetical protein